jgi:hypothetical protein
LRERDHLEDLGIDVRIILKLDLQEVGWGVGGRDWIDLAMNRVRLLALVIAVMNLWVP